MDALNIALPAAIKNPPMNANIHIGTNSFDKNANTINTDEAEKLIANIQKRDLELNLNIPKIITEIRDAAVQVDIMYPYCSTENPFSIVKGSKSENGPEDIRLIISKQGMKSLRWRSENISVIAAFESLKTPRTEIASPCCTVLGIEMNNSETAE